MHVGMSAFFQNLTGTLTDQQVYIQELSLAGSAEPLGFESIWSAEHHFDNYTMCPNVIQFLTYMAGRTSRIRLGSMVVVLPWHDPVRVAEEVSVLDHLSGGRVVLGIGRGLGRIEFDGFRLNMGESRARFTEYADAITQALETGHIEYDGEHYKQPRIAIRPRPYKSFRGRVFAAAISPQSAPVLARLGIGMLIIAQKPWDTTTAELETYRTLYREANGVEAPPPVIASFVACHEDESVAREMMETYIRRYSRSALEHYEFENPGLGDINGYEYYRALSRNIARHGADAFVNFLAELQIYGTPDQCLEKIMEHQRLAGSNALIGIFSYGGMPYDRARANMELFARAVLPRLKKLDVGPPPVWAGIPIG